MAEPILWQITADLKTSLEAIDGTPPFFNTVTVDYGKNDQNELAPLGLLLDLTDVSPADNFPNQKTDWFATFTVTAIVNRGAIPAIQARTRLMSDIQRAVMTDPQRSNLAHDTTMLAPQLQDTSDKRVGVDVQCVVRYRTNETDPTSL